MSADNDVLRRAVRAIREQWGEMNGGAWHSVQRFHHEVANWLEIEAEATMPADWNRNEDLGYQSALRIARAYLGETA